MSGFAAFADSLPVIKTVHVTSLCARCYAPLDTRVVKVNGFSEWAYRDVPNNGAKCEVSGFCASCR